MKFPQLSLMTKSLTSQLTILFLLIGLVTITASAQRALSTSAQKAVKGDAEVLLAGEDIDQCAQLNNPACTWQNGNLNENNSDYVEGDSVPYRIVFDGTAAGSTNNVIGIQYDTTEGGKHTLDYLTTFNVTEPGADPCQGVTGCDLGSYSTYAIPIDALVTANCNPGFCVQGGEFRMYNGTITNVSAIVNSGSWAGASSATIFITFDADANGDDPVLAFGGHIGTRLAWGIEGSAISLPGSPYHMRIAGGGGADRSLKVSAVTFPAVITVIKEVTTLDTPPNNTTSTFAFSFTQTQNAVATPFTLIDDVVGGGGGNPLSTNATEIFTALNFGVDNTMTVTEASYSAWTLSYIDCTETSGGLPNLENSTTNLGTRTASLILEEGEIVVCRFGNTQFQPTAAPASISGRTVDSFGNGISSSRITVTNAQTGETFYAITNPFGYYTIEGPEVGNFYIMTVSNKRYTFADSMRTFTLDDNLYDMDFIANP